MTDLEAKALALVNEVFMERCLVPDTYTNRAGNPYHEALCRAIEQHEALKREVSNAVDALKKVWGGGWHQCSEAQMCDRFILPAPDPLVEALEAAVKAYIAEHGIEAFKALPMFGSAKIGEAGE